MISGLKFKFEASQVTGLTASELVKNIVAILAKENYEIEDQTNRSIVFSQEPFGLVWNFEAPYLLDGGQFEFKELGAETTVVLTYFVSMAYSLLVFMAVMIFVVATGFYWGLLLFGAFFLFAGARQFFITKTVGKELLAKVLTETFDAKSTD
ncbi:hypothetical protein VRU48_16060 [Pedobacter sp. KR3-3]|uniref:Uncharacterized protein n=1 Tax=Pedobacter albus TaxID=3113905 RepID=A0ABU7IB89_9SPHI|nr:hypothetical protein [Pedobacter sp. KR3-3]MEE1946641.1 hypothetical protein [Pedobacter sp. KR3-3]